eukprot:TRINITY_DN10720_c0_g1_i1.p1 TRINITY_DN10720_c0_g1~~TRINITY_DN10720_c0_g1_i1.p1  ORF type:complete len:210 (-),score=53.61 TRINITY_DN10720_c0_g1_i1:167-796(-)
MEAVFSFVAAQVGRRFTQVVVRLGSDEHVAPELEASLGVEVQEALGSMLYHAWGVVDANQDGELSIKENRELISVYTYCLGREPPAPVTSCRWIPMVVDAAIEAMMDSLIVDWRSLPEESAVANQVKIHFSDGMLQEVGSLDSASADTIWASMDENADGRVVRAEFVSKFLEAVRIVPTLVHTTCQAAKCIYDLVNDREVVENLSLIHI